ncbi:MAG: terminase large subunit domain-containing protein, partial [Arenimonas sp.]
FRNGSTINLCHCQHEKDRFKYQGPEIHVLMLDELTHFTPTIYRYLRGRVRLGGLRLPEAYRGMFPRVLAGSNPGGVGHNWVKADFVDNAAEDEIKVMPPAEGGMKRQFIRALLEDNPTLIENDPDYEQRLEGLGDPALVRAMRLGDWDIVSGGMFDDVFSRAQNVATAFSVPEGIPVYRAFDWGSSAPFSVGWWMHWPGGTAPDGRHYAAGTVFRVGEWYGWNGRANEGRKMLARDIAREILAREKAAGWNVQPGPADSAIYAEENGNCIARDMADAGVRWIPCEKGAGSRKAGWQRMREMLAAARQSPMEHPALIVFDSCVQWIRTVPTLPRDERDRDDVDTKAEDHIADETRYFLMGSWGKGNAW